MQPANMNEKWYNTVMGLIYTDMQANPSTEEISKFFSEDAQFYLGESEDPINKATFLKIYKVVAEDNVVAMYSPQENKVSQVGEDEKAYMRWEIVESIQKRLFDPYESKRKVDGEQIEPSPAYYRVNYVAHLYLNEEAKIYKSIQIRSSIVRINDIGSQIANNNNNEVLQV